LRRRMDCEEGWVGEGWFEEKDGLRRRMV